MLAELLLVWESGKTDPPSTAQIKKSVFLKENALTSLTGDRKDRRGTGAGILQLLLKNVDMLEMRYPLLKNVRFSTSDIDSCNTKSIGIL